MLEQQGGSVIGSILVSYLLTFAQAIVIGLSLAVALGITIFVFDKMTKIDEWAEIEKGNMAMAIIIVTLFLVVGLLVHRGL
jgi:uncharacterized membrane protein YjfL (UPF0719 family)